VTPEQAAHETRTPVVILPSKFMFDDATLARGAELGFNGFDFYVAGRGGALGDVPADVVVAAFVFFGPDAVTDAWERSAPIMPRRDAAREFSKCAHSWADKHLADDVDWPRLAFLTGKITETAPVAGAPVFAGWRDLPEPSSPKALAVHRLNALRELRGGMHGAAVLTVGLTPPEAVSVLTPQLVTMLGWEEPAVDADALKDRWQLAESRTDRMVGKHYARLTETERDEFVALLQAAGE
jgi:hypothetical protein